MSKALNLSGAVASTAGDVFHETWALRETLRLLDPRSGLTTLCVEGVRDSAETDPAASWDGVDCALYYDEPGEPHRSRVELVQLKYSVAYPNKSWTLSRFCKSTSKKGNNSVARRLGTAFKAIKGEKSFSDVRRSVTIRLVTNQPISKGLADQISKISQGALNGQGFDELKEATGLSKIHVKLFCECLKLEGEEDSRDTLRTHSTQVLAKLLVAPPVDTVDGLLGKIHAQMLPENRRAINKATVMGWFGCGQEEALFPRDPRLEPLGQSILRAVVGELAAAAAESPLVCFHGAGGCGKTTTARTLESALPQGSRVILYDCYGAGSYGDASQARHRPLEAFSQLANELARTTRSPLLFPFSQQSEMASAFRRKLEQVAKVFRVEHPAGALLVLVIDAADNVVQAARRTTPPDPCFVHQLASFADLPENVRVVISARSGRIDELRLPEDTPMVRCPRFSFEETAEFVRLNGFDGSPTALEDFHELSNQTPRVQANALEGANNLDEAINFLRPNGRSLSELFKSRLDDARNRASMDCPRALICAALTELPAPIPIRYFTEVCGMPVAVCCDLIVELTQRNVRLTDDQIEFSNEDFEAFCANEGAPRRNAMVQTAASLLLRDRLESEYAAIHLFDLLARAKRKTELQRCLREKDATKIIRDPVKRRQAELGRLHAALHVAAGEVDNLAIGTTIFLGAESIRTDGKVRQVMQDNADLSAAFVPDSIAKQVLNDPKQRANQGPLLMHLAAEQARAGEMFDARQRLSAANSWLQTLFDERDEHHDWRFEPNDIVARLMAVYRHSGWNIAEEDCSRWRPTISSANLRRLLIRRITLEGGVDALDRVGNSVSASWRFLVINALVRAGHTPNRMQVQAALKEFPPLDFASFDADGGFGSRRTMQETLCQEAMVFLETAARDPALGRKVGRVLDKVWPEGPSDIEKFYLDQPAVIDLVFRSARLRAQLAGVTVDLKLIYIKPDELDRKTSTPQEIAQYERYLERYEQVERLVAIYEALFTAWDEPVQSAVDAVIDAFRRLHERSGRPHQYNNVRTMVGERLLDLFAWKRIPIEDRLDALGRLAHNADVFSNAHEAWYADLLHDPSSHTAVTAQIDAQAARLLSFRIKATEKADGLIQIARTCLPYYRGNAEHYFTQALSIVEEVDLEMIDVLHALSRIISRTQPDTADHRGRINRFARLMHMAGELLQSEDGFPQEEAIEAMTVASPPVAAAVVSRWSDEGFIDRSPDLATFISTGLAQGTLRPAEGLLLSSLLESSPRSIDAQIRAAVLEGPAVSASQILEEHLRRCLALSVPGEMKPDAGALIEQAGRLQQVPPSLPALKAVSAFRTKHRDSLAPPAKPKEVDSLGSIGSTPQDWSGVDPCDPDAMASALSINRSAQVHDQTSFFVQMRAQTTLSDRRSHLDALCEMAKAERFADKEITGLKDALTDWTEPALSRWRWETLPEVLVKLGAKTLGYDWYNEGAFDDLLEETGLDGGDKCALVCHLIETHAFALGSRSLLKLLTVFVNHLEPDEATALVDALLERAEGRLDTSNFDLTRYDLDMNALPERTHDVVATLIYRHLGDIDSRIRWRACHVVRQAARIGEAGLVETIVHMAVNPPDYLTFNDIPFHGLSADLSLAIALARLADDAPDLVAQLEEDILALWDRRKPHLLIGHFLGRALSFARAGGHPILSSESDIASMTGQAAIKAPRPSGVPKISSYEIQESGERFHFDSLDAIRYWYNPALNTFADPPQDVFLQIAERWIVEEWGGTETDSHWDREPRPLRFDDDRYGLWSNRHGSLPVIDRHWLYLQWHGLFAAMGELLLTHAVRDPVEDDWADMFEEWFRRYDTTYEDIWLADLRGPPPLDLRYWQLPRSDDTSWVDQAASIDLSVECLTEGDRVVLSGHRQVRVYEHGNRTGYEEVQSASAFVDTGTAEALLRSLSSAPDPRDVYLPAPDFFGRPKPRDERFHLIPAVSYPREHRDGGIDLQDLSRCEVKGITKAPSTTVIEALALSHGTPSCDVWTRPGESRAIALYRTWSSAPETPEDPHRRYRSKASAEGDRLEIDREALRGVMKSIERDLIVIVHLTRSTGDKYGRSRRTEEKEQRVAKVFILRRDGHIQSADSSHGTWQKAD